MQSDNETPVGRSRALWVLGVAIVAMLLLLLAIPWLANSREQARAAFCQQRLASIARAMRDYEADYGCLPPAYVAGPDGKPWHSWRVLLLPYLDQEELARRYRFDEPWDGPHNRQLHEKGVAAYRCPSDDSALNRTSYLVVTGKGTMFDPEVETQIDSTQSSQQGTILVAEATGHDVHWMEPRDLSLENRGQSLNALEAMGITSCHPQRVHVAMVDGSVRTLADEIDQEVLDAMLKRKPNKAETSEREQ